MNRSYFRKLLAISAFAAILAAPLPARAANLSLDGNLIGSCGTATASAAAATLNNKCGVITSESLTTLPDSDYALTLTNSAIAAADIVIAMVGNGTNTGGDPIVKSVVPAAGSAVIRVQNTPNRQLSSFNGTIAIRYFVIKP